MSLKTGSGLLAVCQYSSVDEVHMNRDYETNSACHFTYQILIVCCENSHTMSCILLGLGKRDWKSTSQPLILTTISLVHVKVSVGKTKKLSSHKGFDLRLSLLFASCGEIRKLPNSDRCSLTPNILAQ